MPAQPQADENGIAACIGLGSNVGDRRVHIRAAVAALSASPGILVESVSPLHETQPVGPVPQGLYLNAAAVVRTRLEPRAMLERLLVIERARGRDRSQEQRWGPRTLDMDLLLYGDRIVSEPGLTIPHPRLHERMFVLVPLAEVAPRFVVPTLGRTVLDLLRNLQSAGSSAANTPKE
jgi:2-amino-4-hydroxy-6-hydroxymethyldihydropteridine diphosphokinase